MEFSDRAGSAMSLSIMNESALGMQRRHSGYAFSEPRGVDIALGTVWMNHKNKPLSSLNLNNNSSAIDNAMEELSDNEMKFDNLDYREGYFEPAASEN